MAKELFFAWQKGAEADAASFRKRLRVAIRSGAQDVNTALRWLTDGEVFFSSQCIEHWVFEQGFLYTQTGLETLRRLNEITTFRTCHCAGHESWFFEMED